MEKICTKCQTVKTLDLFHNHKGKPFGKAIWCKDCVKNNSKNHYRKVPRKHRIKVKSAWREKNRQHVNSYNESIRKKYPHKHAERQRLRSARARSAQPPWVDQAHKNRITEIYRCSKEFSEKFNRKYHVDHIIPLNGSNVCGLHVWWNLQILDANTNMKKSNKHAEKW